MKTVKVTIKFEFETDGDKESLTEAIAEKLEYMIAEDELMDNTKVSVTEEIEDEDYDYEDEDEE